jgi:hypothetical protein
MSIRSEMRDSPKFGGERAGKGSRPHDLISLKGGFISPKRNRHLGPYRQRFKILSQELEI